ncbi:MAG: RelA/SpoT domain-containing protein [Nitrosospira sp.]
MAKRRMTRRQIDRLLDVYRDRRDELDLFRKQVAEFFLQSKRLQSGTLPLVHSVKSRLKDEAHLREKIARKFYAGELDSSNIFEKLTDLAGVRVLHLHTKQFSEIHSAISDHVVAGHWKYFEKPIAYSWDPEATDFFKRLGIKAVTRDSYYTSIHYVVKPYAAAHLTCEIQIRTLFEEVWGEIDHAFNYPTQTANIACREQLRVLSKLASTGTRLADSIFKVGG